MTARNREAMWIAMIAGILLFISGTNGAAAWETIKEFVNDHFADNIIIQYIFVVLIFIASFGGISVIAGGLFIGKDKGGTGKFLIALGAGIGFIGLIFSCYVAYKEGNLTIGSFCSVGALGIVLSIVARFIAR
jgi:hypothetical protein